MKLEVGPGSLTPLLPIGVSLVVSTANTELLAGSNEATMLRLGEIAIMPGLVPAPMWSTRAMVSFVPFTMTSPPQTMLLVTPWEASTRSGKTLTIDVELPPPQELTARAAGNPTTSARTRFFKQRAPKNMKKIDLVAKWWIITD